jgi:acyl-coenzyme A thioesterase PaaI-like protein
LVLKDSAIARVVGRYGQPARNEVLSTGWATPRPAAVPGSLAVIINLSIKFIVKASAAELLAEARLMNPGKWLAVRQADIRSAGGGQPIATRRPHILFRGNEIARGTILP